MSDLLSTLAWQPPELLWGIIARGIGLVFFISFASLTGQVLPAAGQHGVQDVSARLDAIRRDFPTWRRFVYFPTLQWLGGRDGMLRALPWVGLVGAIAIIVGGPWSPFACVLCYAVYLSLDRAMVLIYPWDCMLFEAAFFSMLLPATHTLPDVTMSAAPLPAIVWVYRLLVFRVIFGFGKFKFVGTTSRDTAYLKSFFVNQPLPSPFGWAAQHLPLWMLKAALLVMFVIEIILPFFVFFPGPLSTLGGVSIALLMVLIWMSGTFGYFNVVMIILSLSWWDSVSATAFSFSGFFSLEGPVAVHALVLLHTVGALLSFPFNSFCANTWLLWSWWLRIRPRFLQAPITLYRFLHPLRWLHSYGVFPPATAAPVKMVPVMEVTWDEETWHPLEHVYSPTLETSRPKFCAPHHARLDQALIYEVFGLGDVSVMRNLAGWWEPYGHGRVTGSALLARRVLEQTVPGTVFYDKTLEHERGAPKAVRVRTHTLEPTPIREMLETGRWWKKTLVGPHVPPMRLDDYWYDAVPPPELWHFDDLIWLRRSRMGRTMQRAVRGEDVHALVLADPDGLSAEDVTRFWDEFLPLVLGESRHDYDRVHEVVGAMRARFDAELLYRFERIAGRYRVLLFALLEPLFVEKGLWPIFGKVKPTIDAKTYYHLGLLAFHVLGEGRAAFDAVVSEPASAAAHLERMTMQTGSYFDVLFRYEANVFQAQKLRLLERFLEHEGRPQPTEGQKRTAARLDQIARRLFGAIDMVEFLKTQFQGDQHVLDVPERWPRFVSLESGEVRKIASAEAPIG